MLLIIRPECSLSAEGDLIGAALTPGPCRYGLVSVRISSYEDHELIDQTFSVAQISHTTRARIVSFRDSSFPRANVRSSFLTVTFNTFNS